jgi:hypothetical protein
MQATFSATSVDYAAQRADAVATRRKPARVVRAPVRQSKWAADRGEGPVAAIAGCLVLAVCALMIEVVFTHVFLG